MGCNGSKCSISTQTNIIPKIDQGSTTDSIPTEEKGCQNIVPKEETSTQTSKKNLRTTATQTFLKLKFEETNPINQSSPTSSKSLDFFDPLKTAQDPKEPPKAQKSTGNGTKPIGDTAEDAIDMGVTMNVLLDEEAIASAKSFFSHILTSSSENEQPTVTPMKKSAPGKEITPDAPDGSSVPVAKSVQRSEGTPPEGSKDKETADGEDISEVDAREKMKKDNSVLPPLRINIVFNAQIKDNNEPIVPLPDDDFQLVNLSTEPLYNPDAQKEKKKEDPSAVPPPTAVTLFLEQLNASKVSEGSKVEEDVRLTTVEAPHLNEKVSESPSKSQIIGKQPVILIDLEDPPVKKEDMNDGSPTWTPPTAFSLYLAQLAEMKMQVSLEQDVHLTQLEIPDITGEESVQKESLDSASRVTNKEPDDMIPVVEEQKDDIEVEIPAWTVSGDTTLTDKIMEVDSSSPPAQPDFTAKRLEEKSDQQRSIDLVSHFEFSEETALTSQGVPAEQQTTPKAKKSVWKKMKKNMGKAVRRLKK